MITFETPKGTVSISENYFARLIGNAVSSCYGISNMVPHNSLQFIRDKINNRRFKDTGIKVTGNSDSIIVDLHITVSYGLNISEISRSIINKVTYVVEQATGIRVEKVLIHVDGMNA